MQATEEMVATTDYDISSILQRATCAPASIPRPAGRPFGASASSMLNPC